MQAITLTGSTPNALRVKHIDRQPDRRGAGCIVTLPAPPPLTQMRLLLRSPLSRPGALVTGASQACLNTGGDAEGGTRWRCAPRDTQRPRRPSCTVQRSGSGRWWEAVLCMLCNGLPGRRACVRECPAPHFACPSAAGRSTNGQHEWNAEGGSVGEREAARRRAYVSRSGNVCMGAGAGAA